MQSFLAFYTNNLAFKTSYPVTLVPKPLSKWKEHKMYLKGKRRSDTASSALNVTKKKQAGWCVHPVLSSMLPGDDIWSKFLLVEMKLKTPAGFYSQDSNQLSQMHLTTLPELHLQLVSQLLFSDIWNEWWFDLSRNAGTDKIRPDKTTGVATSFQLHALDYCLGFRSVSMVIDPPFKLQRNDCQSF